MWNTSEQQNATQSCTAAPLVTRLWNCVARYKWLFAFKRSKTLKHIIINHHQPSSTNFQWWKPKALAPLCTLGDLEAAGPDWATWRSLCWSSGFMGIPMYPVGKIHCCHGDQRILSKQHSRPIKNHPRVAMWTARKKNTCERSFFNVPYPWMMCPLSG